MKRDHNATCGSGIVQLLLMVLASIMTASCASMINPHLDVGERPAATVADGEGGLKGRSISIDEAVVYANRAKDAYRTALGDETTFRSLLGVGLIGVSTAVPIMALADASRTAIGITAAAGAGAYGLGLWLQSTPRQRAFIQGYNAINCAIDAVSPLRNAQFGESYKTFADALAAVDQQIEVTNGAIAGVGEIRDQDPARADAAVAVARAAIVEAKAARTAAVELQLQLGSGGDNLLGAVDRIVGEVDLMILENQPDLAALSSIIGGLGGIYGRLSAIPPGIVGGDEIKAGATGLARETGATLEARLRDLQAQVARLATHTRQMGDFVNAVISRKPVEALKKCSVDPAQIATPLRVEPANAVFAGGVKDTQAFVVRGGARPYRVALLTGQEAGVVVSQPDLFGPAFVVQIEAETPQDIYNVFASDAAGRSTIFKVVVGTPSSPGPAATNGKKTKSTPGGEAFEARAESDRKKIQTALCVHEDGKWGPQTRAALQRRHGTDTATVALMDELLAMSDSDVQKRCGTELLAPIATFLIGRTPGVPQGGQGFAIAVEKASVGVRSGKPEVRVKLNVPAKPSTEITIDDLRNAVFEEAKTMASFPNDFTVEMIRVENAQALEDGGLLEP